MVSSLQFLPGGYGADHSRGLGGVIEVETRAPRNDGYHGFVQLDLIDGSLLVEGPITKNLSFAAGVRRSWIDTFLPLFTTNDFQLAPVYYDYQAKLKWRASPRDDIDLFIFGSDDSVKLQTIQPNPALSAEFESHTYYHRILARWQHRFANRSVLTVTPSFGYDVPFNLNATFGNTNIHVDAETFEYNLRATWRMPLSRQVRLDAGLDLEGNRWTVSALAPTTGMPREGDVMGGGRRGTISNDALTLDQLGLAPYLALQLTLFNGHLLVVPQVRFDVYDFRGYQSSPAQFDHAQFALEPRLTLRYQINKFAAIKAALGAYNQAPDPSSFLQAFGSTSLGLQQGWHYVLGADFQPTATLHIEVQGFYKDLRNLVVRGENVGDPLLENDGRGRVYGGELLIRQELWKNFFGWIAYTLSRSERQDHPDQPWRLFQYDQTHILTIIGSYKLPRGYQVGIRFRYVTGNPHTPVLLGQGYFDSNTGGYVPLHGPTYGERLPAFNQLDLRFDKKWTFNKWALSVYVDIQNLYNAKNPEGLTFNFNYTQVQSVSGLPFLPVVGIRGDF
jgi:hypothetical protein